MCTYGPMTPRNAPPGCLSNIQMLTNKLLKRGVILHGHSTSKDNFLNIIYLFAIANLIFLYIICIFPADPRNDSATFIHW